MLRDSQIGGVYEWALLTLVGMSKSDLVVFEQATDARIKTLPVLRLPIRATYSALCGVISNLLSGTAPRPPAASSLALRLAYLSALLAQCPVFPLGTSAKDALSAYFECDADGSQTRDLTAYAHFSQIMPEVHRNYYQVTTTADGFRLDHKTDVFALYEAKDILLSELALAFVQLPSQASILLSDLLEHGLEEIRNNSAFSGGALVTIKALADLYEANICEVSLMSDEGYVAATGGGRAAFSRVQSVIMAFCDYASSKASQIFAIAQQDDALAAEGLEWRTIFWYENPFLGMLQALVGPGITAAEIDGILECFSIDFRTDPPTIAHAADGFFPPLIRLPDSVLFSPDLLRMFFQSRNVLYSLKQRDQSRFDNFVSAHLEPHLLNQAAAILRAVPGVQVALNVPWKCEGRSGEVDIIAYDSLSNIAVQIQAKAAIPPQGARLVTRVENRIAEGIKQLREVDGLNGEAVDAIVSAAIGHKVHDVRLFNVLLARASIGTGHVREGVIDVSFVTLPLLAVIARAAINSAKAPNLLDILKRSETYLEDLVTRTNASWKHETLAVGDKALEIPMLQYDETLMHDERRTAYAAMRSFGIA